MLCMELDRNTGVLTVRPEGPLTRDDFLSLAAVADSYIQEEGSLRGIIIRFQSFPGWESLVGMVEHFRFVKDHHRSVRKVALVSDGRVARLVPGIADHFVSAEVSVFPYAELEAAREWVLAEDT